MVFRLRRWVLQLQDVARQPETLQHLIVELGQSVGADACTLFLADHKRQILLMVATYGLAPELIGQLRIPIDQGLVGRISQRQEHMRLRDARRHPDHLVIPGLGEERCRAFLGVPIVHLGQTIGVLVAQHCGRRQFSDEDEALFLTLAAQLAEPLADAVVGRFGHETEARENIFHALAISPGIAMGTAYVQLPDISLSKVPDRKGQQRDIERARLRQAVKAVQSELKHSAESLSGVLSDQDLILFDTYGKILSDAALWKDMERHLSEGYWAPSALKHAVMKYAGRLAKIEDPYLAERAEDIIDLGQRVLTKMLQADDTGEAIPSGAILVAQKLTAAMLAQLPRKRVAGVVSLDGSATSHVAILTRALGLPAVFGLDEADLKMFAEASVIVDGYRGQVFVNPEPKTENFYRVQLRREKQQKRFWRSVARREQKAPEPLPIQILTNIGVSLNPEREIKDIADGVGLFRTEVPFMLSDHFLSETEQERLYRKVLRKMKGKPVVIRTLDIGGDKPLPYFHFDEPNPSLGWRGIRVSLAHPEIFLSQLRAMLKANVGLNNLHIALPMISDVGEVDASIALLKQAKMDVLAETGLSEKAFTMPSLGLVIEVPSCIFQLEKLVQRVDFISIGTNDLTQYLLARDRTNPKVSKQCDPLHPAVLLAIRQIVRRAHQEGCPVHVCGEMAGDVFGAALLVGIGVDALSMNGASLPRIRAMLSQLETQKLASLARQAWQKQNADEVRLSLLRTFERWHLGDFIGAPLVDH